MRRRQGGFSGASNRAATCNCMLRRGVAAQMMSAWSSLGVCILMVGGTLGCSESAEDAPRGTVGAGAGGAPLGGASAGSGAGALAASGAAGVGDAIAAFEAPDEAQALVAFLEAKQYAGWAKEAEYHLSAGPHGDGVRVYYSPKAATALNSGAATFPAGAASVKELTSSGSLYGYSVWVKVQDATDGGNGFFWYELIHHGGGNDTVYGNARGSSDCVGCHGAGKDYSLSTLPFE